MTQRERVLTICFIKIRMVPTEKPIINYGTEQAISIEMGVSVQ